jgi:hypothetical protein
MAIRRFSTSTIVNNLLRYAKFWDQTSTFSAAPTNSYIPIASYTVPSGGQASITFSGLPQTFTHLQIRGMYAQSVTNYTGIRFNGDTGNNYTIHTLQGNGSAASATAYTSRSDTATGDSSSTSFGSFITDILDYANLTKYKTQRTLYGFDSNGSGIIFLTSGLWQSTSAINSITFTATSSASFSQYTNISIYGVN